MPSVSVSNLTGGEQVAEQVEMRREQVRRFSNKIDHEKERERPADMPPAPLIIARLMAH
ncbi:MAG TPA: hypothetical protein VK980_15490 [Sphingomonas sp.]|nr:hypothetical protein [Sphingomonas sp.]